MRRPKNPWAAITLKTDGQTLCAANVQFLRTVREFFGAIRIK